MAQGAEIVEGLFREGDIVTLSGWMGIGKSPLLKDWAIAVSSGIPWCGRQTAQRPVLMIDFEAKEWAFLPALQRMAHRVGIAGVPPLITPYIYNNADRPPETMELLSVCKTASAEDRMNWLRSKLLAMPNALLIVDPLDMLFNIEKNKGRHVVMLFHKFRELSFDFPQAAFIFVYNLRKANKNIEPPNLFQDPRGWLQETAGSLDIQNRSDVRLGFDEYPAEDGILVLNGLRRDEKMGPVLLEPVWYAAPGMDKERETGFKEATLRNVKVDTILNRRQLNVWQQIGEDFTVAGLEGLMPRSSAYNMVQRCLTSGLARKVSEGAYRKAVVS